MIGTRKIVALCTSRIFDPLTHGFIETLSEALKSSCPDSALCVRFMYIEKQKSRQKDHLEA